MPDSSNSQLSGIHTVTEANKKYKDARIETARLPFAEIVAKVIFSETENLRINDSSQ